MSTAPYNDIADWYDEYTRERPIYHEVAMPGLFELMPDIRGQAVCDLACGTGLLSRELAKREARSRAWIWQRRCWK